MITLVNTKEAAQLLGCSPLHVRRLLRQGKLTGVKSGRDWLMFKPTNSTIKSITRGDKR